VNIAAVIVSYNSSGYIGPCLDSCLAFRAAFTSGILVIDNASTDDTLNQIRQRPAIAVLANTTNLGFAAAVNQGFAHASNADAVLVLNPDVVLLQPPTALEDELAQPNIAAAAGLLVHPSGLPQSGFQVRRFPTPAALVFEVLGINRIWPGNPVNTRYRCLDLDLSSPIDVEQPPGACLLIRRLAWLAANGFDEGFHPVWFEDVDFLQRLTSLGWYVRFTPRFRAQHTGGHSFVGIEWGTRQLYWYGSLLRYSVRHFRKLSCGFIGGSIVLGLVPRTVTGMFLQRSRRPLVMYVKVVRLVFTYLWGGRAPAYPNHLVPPPVIEESGPSGS
jgi:N-acetylglucosaminyl-diphospho-decaprenol L-rhamnosyltransferase